MYIAQPDRILLKRQIMDVAHFVHGKVVDIGAGHVDRYSHLFSFDEYVTTDVAPHKRVTIVAPADKLPFPDSSFDSAVSTQVYEHLPQPFSAAAEMYRVLRPGGYAVVTVPQLNELHEMPHDYFRYTSYGLVSLFTSAGFEIVEMHKRGGYYAAVCQIKVVRLNEVWHLQQRPMFGRIVGKILSWYVAGMLKLDRVFPSTTQTIGWCVVLKKPV